MHWKKISCMYVFELSVVSGIDWESWSIPPPLWIGRHDHIITQATSGMIKSNSERKTKYTVQVGVLA